MSDIKDPNLSRESYFANTQNISGDTSTSQSVLGTIADITSIVVVSEKNGMPTGARHFNIERGKNNKIVLGSDMLASMPDRIVFDIKVKSSHPSNESGFGGMYAIGDPPVLFSVAPNSPVTLQEMYSMVGTSQSRGIVTVTLAPIWRRGYFPFEMTINLVDPNTPGRISNVSKPIMEVYTEPRAGNFFDSLDVEIRDTENGKILSVIENRREEIQEIFRSESSDPANCGKPCVFHSSSLEKQFDPSGSPTYVDLRLNAKANLPPSYKGFIIEDGVYSESITSRHQYRGNSFRQASKLSMNLFNFDNVYYAYDQLVSRRILSNGSDENRIHPLVEISDPFSCIQSVNNSNFPFAEFKAEPETIDEGTNNLVSSRAPYVISFNISSIKSTNNIANVFSFLVPNSVIPVSFTIQYLRENDISIRRKNDIGLIFTTTIGAGSSLRSFSNFIRVKTRNEDDPIGSHITYGSGSSGEDMGWPHKDVTIGDLYYLISHNVAGLVDGRLSEDIDLTNPHSYKGGQSCNGLIPTYAECNIISSSPNDPVVSVISGTFLSACYGLPAHRIWLGNNDDSSLEALVENVKSSINSSGGSRLLQIFSRGPEKSFKLNKYSLAMPLARGIGRSFMRQDLKSYENHVQDGDFESLRANRYYPMRSIADAVYFLRHGSDETCKKFGIPEHIKSYLYPFGRNENGLDNSRKPCIGMSNIGIAVNFSAGSEFEPSRFYSEVGSYFMSSLSAVEPYRMTSASVSLSLNKFSSNSMRSIFICYSPGRMFTSPRSSVAYNPSNDYIDSLKPSLGGEWHVLYSTISNDFFGGAKYKDPGIFKYDCLDPMIHDYKASIKSEGGLDSQSRRKVYVNPCIDFGGKGMRINANNVGYDLDEFCISSGRPNGNVQRFVNSDDYGSLGVPCTGDISCIMKITSGEEFSKFDVFFNNSKHKTYENKFGNLLESVNDVLGWSLVNTPSSTLAKEDRVAFEKMRLDIMHRPLPPVEPEPYGEEPYGMIFNPEEPYYSSKIYSETNTNLNSFIDSPYIDPYAEPYLEPYVYPPAPPSRYIYENVLLRSFRSDKTQCNLGHISVISIANMLKDSRYFDFNISDRKNRSISNLVKSVEDRMGAFGVHARSLVPNPEAFISKNVLVKDRSNILDTILSVVTEVTTEVVPLPLPPDAGSAEPYLEPYASYDPYYMQSGMYGAKSGIFYDPYTYKLANTEPYLEPYLGFGFNIIRNPKPVFNVITGISSFNIAVETIDSSYSGAFVLDFDFNVSRRGSPSNSVPEQPVVSEQRPRNDPAVRSLITGTPYIPSSSVPVKSLNSVNANSNPSEIAGENGRDPTAGSGSKSIRDQATEYIRRRQ